MSDDNRKYLLYTQEERTRWMARYGSWYRENFHAWTDWVRGLPPGRWVSIDDRPSWKEAVIGMLCCLYVAGLVNIMFNNTVTAIRREPATEEEWKQWWDDL